MTTKFSTRVVGGAFALALGAGLALPAAANAQIPVNPGPVPDLEVTLNDLQGRIDVTMNLEEEMAAPATCGYAIVHEGVEIAPSAIAWGFSTGGPEWRNADNNFLTNNPQIGGLESSESFAFYENVAEADEPEDWQLGYPALSDGAGTYTINTTCWWDDDRTSASYGPSANYTIAGTWTRAEDGSYESGGVTDIEHFAAPDQPTPPVDDEDDDDDDNGGTGSLEGGSLGDLGGSGSTGDTGSAAAVGSLAIGGGIAAAIHAHNMGMF